MNMKRNPDIINELRSISPRLAEIDPGPVQSVPEGYFDRLPDQVWSRVGKGSSGQALSHPSTAIPAGYFEQLPDRIMDRIREATRKEDLNEDELPPVLSGIDRSMPHHVPDGYFESLGGRLASRLKPAAPVVAMAGRSSWLRYAAAAAVTGLVLLSAWYILLDRPAGGPKAGDMTETASRTNPVDSLQVSDKDLASFLEQTDGLENLNNADTLISANADVALLNLDEKSISEILRTMPDKALAEYIDEPTLNNTQNSSN